MRMLSAGLVMVGWWFFGLVVSVLVYAFILALGDGAYDRGWWVLGAPLRLVATVFLLGILFELVMLAWLVAAGLYSFVKGLAT